MYRHVCMYRKKEKERGLRGKRKKENDIMKEKRKRRGGDGNRKQ